jgi:hypothetical protein
MTITPVQAARIMPCQALFGMERGDQIIAQIERVSGQPCPCKRGIVCPLAGAPEQKRPLLTAM